MISYFHRRGVNNLIDTAAVSISFLRSLIDTAAVSISCLQFLIDIAAVSIATAYNK